MNQKETRPQPASIGSIAWNGSVNGHVTTESAAQPNRRILVIDDNPAIHNDFKKILNPGGPNSASLEAAEAKIFSGNGSTAGQEHFQVDSAFQGGDGVERLRQAVADERPYAMAFVDMRMPPGWDGIETTARIWKADPYVQVVICTAYSDYSWEEMIERLGSSDRLVILKKPFDNAEVSQLAHALTAKWDLAQQARRQLTGLEAVVSKRTLALRNANLALQAEIAERKRTEETLRHSENRFRELVNGQGEGLVFFDAQLRITFANPAAENLFGVWPGQLIRKSLFEFLDDQNKSVVEQQQKLRQTGEKTSYEIEIIPAQGDCRQILITGTPQLDAEGHVCGTFAIFRDVTQRKRAEQAVRENQRLLRAILDNIPDPAWLKDAQGRYQIGNKPLAGIYQQRLEDIMGKTGFEAFPLHATQLAQGDNRVVSSGKPVREEHCLPDRSGHDRWFDTIESPIFDEQGRVAGTVGIARDVTERKQIELALRESEARYRSLFENMLEGLACCRMIFKDGRPDDFVYLEVNTAFEQLTGLRNVGGKKVSEVIPGIQKSNPELFEVYGRVARTGKPEKLETYVPGLDIWFSIAVYSHQRDHFVAVFDNVTKRKRTEEERRQKTALFEALINSSPDGILVVNDAGRKIVQNAQFTRLLKIPDEIAADPDDTKQLRFVTESTRDPEQFQQQVHRLYAEPHEIRRDEIEFKDGRILDRNSAPVSGENGEYYGRLWAFRDITERRRAEQTLQESERMLQEMGRSAKVGGWDLDVITGKGRWTEEVARIYDLEPTIEPSRTLLLSHHRGQSRTLIDVAMQSAIDHGTPYDLELELVTAKRRHKWVRVIGQPVRENGRVVKLHGSMQDITKRKTAELALQSIEQNYREIFNAVNDAIFLHDATGRVLDVNDAALRLYGCESKPEFLAARNRLSGEPPHDQEEYRRRIRLAVEQGPQIFNWLAQKQTGQRFWAEVSLRSSRIGGQGRILAIFRDITDRRRVEEQLHLQTSALSAAANGILITDRTGRILWINPAFSRLTGYDAIEAIGKTPALFKSDKHEPAFYKNLWSIILSGKAWQGELINRRKDGSLYHEEMTITPVLDENGGILNFVAIKQDISQRKQFEQELARERDFLQGLMDNLPDYIYFKDRESRFIRNNRAHARCLGVENPAQVVGKTDADFFSPDFARQTFVDEQRILITGEPLLDRIESPKTADGKTLWVSTNKVPIRAPDGHITGLVGVTRNITERVLAEEALRGQKESFSALANNVPDAVARLDRNFRFIYGNRALARDVRKEPAEFLGKTGAELNLPADNLWRQKLQAVFETGKSLRFEFEWLGDEGICYRESRLVPELSAKGEVEFVLAVTRDVTDSKRQELERQVFENRYRMLFEGAGDAMMILDEKAFLDANDATLKMFHCAGKAEFVDSHPGQFSPPCQPDGTDSTLAANRRIMHAFEQGINRFEWVHRRKTGEDFPAEVLLTAFWLGNRRVLQATVRDLTEIKQAEKARQLMEVQLRQAQKLESIGQLAAGIAHEINTPTQYVGDNTRFLKDAFDTIIQLIRNHHDLLAAVRQNALTPELFESAEKLQKAADVDYLCQQIPQAIQETLEGIERVTKIVRAMKDFSHPGNREKTAADLNKAIESTTTVARNEWKYVADLKLDLAPDLPPVPCFLGEFNQAILNLVINAAHAIGDVVKSNPGAKGLITVQTRRGGSHAEIRISDTGTGIAEVHRAHIFEPFFTTKDVGKGTGQGLTLVYSNIVKKHGGTVTFETETGKGTTFIIRLPLGATSTPGLS